MRSVSTASLAGNASLHTIAPMAAAAPSHPAPSHGRPCHRHGLRIHSTPIRYPHSPVAAAAGTPALGQPVLLTCL